MAAIVRDEPAPRDAPLKLSAIIMRCLRKLPASRFQTMNEVRTGLEQAARGNSELFAGAPRSPPPVPQHGSSFSPTAFKAGVPVFPTHRQT
jgi:hypothetical protein